ncbi:Hypothetical predicted protein [Olea europaea subsp. europaea]|uniref:Uncharacterized protein n=1 Tax=Olea europaea subsp. europaea TaxID=158383 RepID=A0A8S0QKF3_OLEEU|nr:Hypothetical predicted protein [Olea europaea subsp. europaea]
MTNVQAVKAAVPLASVVALSPEKSGDEQVLSSNSSPAATATPAISSRTCTTGTDLLEENERLRKHNSQLSQELNKLRSLCSNIYHLMSNYAETCGDKCTISLPEGKALNLMPETRIRVEDGGGPKSTAAATAVDAEEGITPRLFGVQLRVKRARSKDDVAEDQVHKCELDVKFEPLDPSTIIKTVGWINSE